MDDDPVAVGVGSRREGRETALGLLYEAEIAGASPHEVLERQVVPAERFVVDLVEGVGEHAAELDEVLERWSRGWSVDRMPIIDRLILRMGAYELLHCPDVPTGAALSEAVDLASQYSTEKSATFVNGLLARIATELRPD